MHDASVSGQNTPEPTNPYSPSVPITLYREVTAELQASKAMLNSLKTQNQQLVQQNQHLHRELENLTQAAIQMQQAINTAQKANNTGLPQIPIPDIPKFNSLSTPANFTEVESSVGTTPISSNPVQNKSRVKNTTQAPSPTLPETQPFSREVPEQLFTEQSESENRLRSTPGTQRSDLNGFWLVLSIILIVVIAFGAGYWIVRPILQQQQR